jgi:hypothetical protein
VPKPYMAARVRRRNSLITSSGEESMCSTVGLSEGVSLSTVSGDKRVVGDRKKEGDVT